MLSLHHDQENRAFAHQAGAATKQQNLQKTPGARFPKTPLKVPLNDENAATHVLGGKSVLGGRGGNENVRTVAKGGKGDNKNFMTPGAPQTSRAPLGNKTTNAKARTTQQLTVKDIAKEFEKTTAKPTTARKPKIQAPQADTFKLEVHNDKDEQDNEDHIEYAPPRPEEAPYQSDVFPEGLLSFDAFKPENRLKGFHQYYNNPVDDEGVTLRERQVRAERLQVFKQMEEEVQKDHEEWDWSVGDVPSTKDFFNKRQAAKQALAMTPASSNPDKKGPQRKPPPTIASRKAASALSMPPQCKKPAVLQPKAAKPVNAKTTTSLFHPLMKKPAQPAAAISKIQPKDTAVAAAATRTTLGYNKGRSTSSMIHGRGGPPPPTARKLARTASTASSGSDTTITPARFAQKQARPAEDVARERLEFLSIFDVEEDDDVGFGEQHTVHEEEDETFQFTLPAEN